MQWYFTLILKKLNLNILNKFNYFFYKLYTKNYNFIKILFLRKNKSFIKSKYSRTRQWSKVIVYFGLWYGILSIYVTTLYCYHYLFIFSYTWWIISIILLLITLKYNKKYIKYIL